MVAHFPPSLRPSPQAATLSFEQQNAAEVLVPQLLLKDLLSHGSGDLHEVAMFVKECLEVSCYHDQYIALHTVGGVVG